MATLTTEELFAEEQPKQLMTTSELDAIPYTENDLIATIHGSVLSPAELEQAGKQAGEDTRKALEVASKLTVPSVVVKENWNDLKYLTAGPEDGVVKKMFQKYVREPITEYTGLFSPDISPVGGPRYKEDRPFTTLAQGAGHLSAEALSGKFLYLPNLAAKWIGKATLDGDTIPPNTLAELVDEFTGYIPTESDKQAGGILGMTTGLGAAGKTIGKLAMKLPVRNSLKLIFSSGAIFGTEDAAKQAVNAVNTGEPIDWKELHFSTGLGAAFGTGEVVAAAILSKLYPNMKLAYQQAKQMGLAEEEAQVKQDVQTAREYYREHGEMPKDLMEKYVYGGKSPKAAPASEVKVGVDFGKRPIVLSENGGILPQVEAQAVLEAEKAIQRSTASVESQTPQGTTTAGAEPQTPINAPQKPKSLSKDEQRQLRVMGYTGDQVKKVNPDEARELLAQMAELDEESTAVVASGNRGGFVPIPEMIQNVGKKVREAFSASTYAQVFDKNDPIVQLSRKAGELKPGENPELLARNYMGVAGKAERVLMHSTFRAKADGNIEVTGEGLKPILDNFDKTIKKVEPSAGIRKQDLNDYLIAQRTIEDLQRPNSEGKNIVTPEQVTKAEQSLDKLKNKYGGSIAEIEKTAQRIYDFQKRVLHMLVDAGNLSKESYKTITDANPHYIPFQRVFEEGELEAQGIGKTGKFTGSKAPVFKIEGSERDIENTLESMIKNLYKAVDRADRNIVAKSVAKLSPILPDDIKPRKGNNLYKPKGNVIEYYDNGKVKYVEVSRPVFESMAGLNEASVGLLTKILSVPKNILTKGATLTPEFATRNPIRDQYSAWIQTQVGFVPFYDTARGLADVVGRSDVYYDWLASGGAQSGFVELSNNSIKKAINELDKHHRLLRKLNIITTMSDFSQMMEMATRVGVYRAGLRSGKSSVEAGFVSRESTVDFARHGSKTADADAIIAFFRASMQAADRSARATVKDPIGVALKSLVAITVPSVLLYAVNRNNPSYKEIPQWQKDLFWIVPIGGINFRLPKPLGYGQVFGSLAERFLEYLDTKDPDAFKGMIKSFATSFAPVSDASDIVPTGLMPFIENSIGEGGYSFFRGTDIVPRSKQDELPEYQYGPYTSETAKMLGKAFKYSPAKIENLATGFFAGSADYGFKATDALIDGIRKSAQLEREPERNTALADIPVVKGFVVRDPESGQAKSFRDFYDNAEKVSKAYNSFKEAVKQGNTKQANDIAQEYPYLVGGEFLPKMIETMSQYNAEITKAYGNANITADERESQLKMLYKARLELAQSFNAILEQSQKSQLAKED